MVLVLAPVLFLAASLGMFAGIEPFHTLYYEFAWWSLILFLEAWLHRQGARRSFASLFARPGRFVLLAFFSITFWCLFEALNFRLDNWGYSMLPARDWIRWSGYFTAYATVLPGIFAVKDTLAFYGVLARVPAPKVKAAGLRRPLLLLGSICLVLPMAWPRHFFPLVWGAAAFVLAAVNHGRDSRSLLAAWERGRADDFVQLLGAGAVCGLLWEFWNFWAGAKWFYTVPFVGEYLKVFEMPLLGFLGFPPFAVECWAGSVAFFAFWDGPLSRHRLWRPAVLVAMLVADLVVFAGIDRFTVASTVLKDFSW